MKSQRLTTTKISLLTYFAGVQILLVIGCIAVIGFMFYIQASNQLDRDLGKSLANIAQAGVVLTDGDNLAELKTGDEGHFYYRELCQKLGELQKRTGATFVYTMRLLGPEQPAFVVDPDPKEPNPINGKYDGFEPEMEQAFNGKPAVNPHPLEDTSTNPHTWSRSAYAPILNSTGQVVAIIGVDISADQIQKEKNDLILKIVLMGLLAVAIACLVAWGSARRLGRPLKLLMARLDAIASARGDLTKRLEIGTIFQEIAELASTVNRVQDNARGTLKSVANVTGGLSEISEKLMSISRSLNMSGAEVSASIEEIWSGAETQSHNTEAIAQAMEEISVSSSEVAASASKAEEITLYSARTAENGQSAVRETISILLLVREFAGRFNDLSIDLNVRSEQIKKLLDLLNNIARQTKVLALNANIEAARAGEYGRGFSVVAQEVRSLADNSQSSVAGIGSQVSEVRNVLAETVSLVQKFNELIEESDLKIRETEESLVAIQESSSESLSFVHQVTDLVNSQAGRTEEATAMAQNIADIGKKFVESSETVVYAVENQSQAMQTILDVAQSIQDMVFELRRMVEECKLD